MAPDGGGADNRLVGEGKRELAQVVVGPPAKREEGKNLNPPCARRARCLAARAPIEGGSSVGRQPRRTGLGGRPSGAGTGGGEWRSGEKIPLRASRHGDFGQLRMKASGGRRDRRGVVGSARLTPVEAACWGAVRRSGRPLAWRGRRLPRGGRLARARQAVTPVGAAVGVARAAASAWRQARASETGGNGCWGKKAEALPGGPHGVGGFGLAVRSDRRVRPAKEVKDLIFSIQHRSRKN
jgi:hypothetical protein